MTRRLCRFNHCDICGQLQSSLFSLCFYEHHLKDQDMCRKMCEV